MHCGIEITQGVWIRYGDIVALAKGKDGYSVSLVNGDIFEFDDPEVFERVRNHITMGHPVLDYINPPDIDFEQEPEEDL